METCIRNVIRIYLSSMLCIFLYREAGSLPVTFKPVTKQHSPFRENFSVMLVFDFLRHLFNITAC